MGESPLESPIKVEKEMGESGTDQVRSGDVGGLRVSVSFGKYENESLSWEKWSAFPTNKYLEEVGKFSTPGSVAQKKAYFEAHYKKIAARKQQLPQQEQVDQEKMKGDEPSGDQQLSLENRTVCDSRYNSCVVGSDVDEKSTVEDAVNEDGVECRNGGGIDSLREIGGGCGDEPTVVADFDQSNRLRLVIEHDNHELSTRADSPKSNEAEQRALIREEAPSLGSQDMEGFLPDKETGAGGANVAIKELEQNVYSARSTPVQKPEKAESCATKKQHMVIATKKTNGMAATKKPNATAATKKPNAIAAAKKKPISPSPRSPMSIPRTAKPTLSKSDFSTPKTEKPALSKLVTSTPKTAKAAPSKSLMSTTKSSVKKENDYRPSTTSNKTTKIESKRVASTSLHMSLSIDPAKSMPAASLPETRKSLFVESMGDKEIVRRAFKAFQNRYNQQPFSRVQGPFPTTQVSKKELEPRGSAFDTSQVKSKGVPKAVAVVQKSPQGTRRNSLMSPGYNCNTSLDTGVAVQRNGKTFSASFGSRSVDKLSKKSEDKSNGKQAVKIQLQNRPKMQEREETKKLGQSLDLKSKPTSSYRRPAVTMAN